MEIKETIGAGVWSPTEFLQQFFFFAFLLQDNIIIAFLLLLTSNFNSVSFSTGDA